MLSILVLIIVYAFDVHNVIRAKLKVDIAQQSAAMTGAVWQKETLNLLGEINLLKASALLLEGSDNWKTPLPNGPGQEEARQRELQARIDLLTEMQTRVSFIGPLMGFAAAQQAAKANGLNRISGAFDTYLELLRVDKRYDEAQGGAPRQINNYLWKEPYINLVSTINDAGIAVFPNARTAGMPIARPSQLTNVRFYEEILKNAEAIAAVDPPKKHYWNLSASILKSMDDKDFQGKWWDIDYRHNRFPSESEIFTVGVEFGGEYDNNTRFYANSLKPELQLYAGQGSLPGQMKWCIYDNWWYPDYYKNNYPEYEDNHYSYWYKNGVLRKELKEGYIYEGPAAYTEGFADVPGTVKWRPSVRPYQNSIANRDAREAIRQEDPILRKQQPRSSRVGTRRGRADNSDVSTSYRPGSIAKVLGSFNDQRPPIAIDMILPVFKKVSPVPTFMPIPYGFQVLKPGYSDLEKFLSWLADQPDLNGTPPAGTEHFLEALHFLVYGVRDRSKGSPAPGVKCTPGSFIAGKGFRYYGYNHNFDKAAFERRYKDRLWEWDKNRNKEAFQQSLKGETLQNRSLDGPGWLQEPKLFSSMPRLTVFESRDPETGEVKKRYGIAREEKDGTKYYYVDPETHKMAVPDIHGGTAYRVYLDVKKNASGYYVIDSRGNIVLNGSYDPTILYNQYFGGDGGTCHCQGECTCKSVWNPGKFDGTKGPARL